MKNEIQLNIGLLTSESTGTLPVDPKRALLLLSYIGLTDIKHDIEDSECKDGEEPCLVVRAKCPLWLPKLREGLLWIAFELKQDCIAFELSEPFLTLSGLVGPKPYDRFESGQFKRLKAK